jgi:hypothetical protein
LFAVEGLLLFFLLTWFMSGVSVQSCQCLYPCRDHVHLYMDKDMNTDMDKDSDTNADIDTDTDMDVDTPTDYDADADTELPLTLH